MNFDSSIKSLPVVTEKTGWPWTEEVSPRLYDTRVTWPKITIVTPSFNQGHYIEETIRSVLLQNYPNLEYIIIDGGSKDNTLDILKSYEPWLTKWVSEADNGQSDAINKGIRNSTGLIFNWLNSDDYYLPETLFKVANYFLDNNVDIVCGTEFLCFDGRRELTPGTTVKANIEETVLSAHIDQPPTFFKLKNVKEINGVDTHLHYLMDSELWLKYLLAFGQHKVLKVKDVFNVFRMHEASKTTNLGHSFKIERFFLRYILLKKIGVKEDILNEVVRLKYQKNELKEYLKHIDSYKWQISISDNNIKLIKELILRDYVISAYSQRKFKLCKGILGELSFNFIIKNQPVFFVFLKMLLMPKSLLNIILRLKYK